MGKNWFGVGFALFPKEMQIAVVPIKFSCFLDILETMCSMQAKLKFLEKPCLIVGKMYDFVIFEIYTRFKKEG